MAAGVAPLGRPVSYRGLLVALAGGLALVAVASMMIGPAAIGLGDLLGGFGRGERWVGSGSGRSGQPAWRQQP